MIKDEVVAVGLAVLSLVFVNGSLGAVPVNKHDQVQKPGRFIQRTIRVRTLLSPEDSFAQEDRRSVTVRVAGKTRLVKPLQAKLPVIAIKSWTPIRSDPDKREESSFSWVELLVEIDTSRQLEFLRVLDRAHTIQVVNYSSNPRGNNKDSRR